MLNVDRFMNRKKSVSLAQVPDDQCEEELAGTEVTEQQAEGQEFQEALDEEAEL